MDFETYLLEQIQMHPALQPQDIWKLCYQAAFGPEHLLNDLQGAREYLEKEYEEDEEVKIIRTKKFDIKPQYPEDACVQMELLGHNFYVFVNAETDQVNVVYKRKGDTYGLIEPEE